MYRIISKSKVLINPLHKWLLLWYDTNTFFLGKLAFHKWKSEIVKERKLTFNYEFERFKKNRKATSAFSSEQLITELSLYERVLITTDDVGFVPATYDGDIPYVCVSNDVKMLHEFCQSEKPIMLPCSNCHDDRPFKQFQGWNPRKSIISKSAESKHKYTPSESSVNSASSMDKESEKYNMFNPTPNKPHYKFGEERLADIDQSQFQDYPWDMYVCECGNQCKRGILDNIFELRKDFICTLVQCFFDNHILFSSIFL